MVILGMTLPLQDMRFNVEKLTIKANYSLKEFRKSLNTDMLWNIH